MRGLFTIAALAALSGVSFGQTKVKFAVIISADIEWKTVKRIFPNEKFLPSPWGEYFLKDFEKERVLVFHEGWGKVAAAGATQYVIDQFHPEILINLGTCGGFEGAVERHEIILADRTVIYDIVEAMGDSKEAIADYATDIDLSWLRENYPVTVRKTGLVSADKDLRPEEIAFLKKEYSAVAGDWESGAIAYTAKRNKTSVLILRGVTDLVGAHQGEAYGNLNLYEERTEKVMQRLLNDLPLWIRHISGRK
ncbi:MAG TPA: 5'-methylthioadenosine/S-adenosylhomocysteine nucleosidase [Cyclobacteriaceae bacterium]|nr:5'-methylthioadenosine/S-adenosylhomocysteine nucleosidase [Cyclobacteriaceae bacterium]